MKIYFFLLTSIFANIAFAQHENHIPKADTTKTVVKPKSPKTFAMAMVGNNHVHIDYSSPSVRGRNIWNGLVAYNQIWATGAHKATSITFSEDVKIDGKLILKGKYGFFTIPSKDTWTLILSKTWDMHLADDYKEENDAIRLTVKPHINTNLIEALTYTVNTKNDKKGEITMTWEFLSIGFDFENSN